MVVVLLVEDEAKSSFSSTCRAFIAALFGATEIYNLAYRGSYGPIGYTGATPPLSEKAPTERAAHRYEQEIATIKQIKAQARRDKKKWMEPRLKTVSNSTVRDKWKGLTQLRKGYQARLMWEGEAQPYHVTRDPTYWPHT